MKRCLTLVAALMIVALAAPVCAQAPVKVQVADMPPVDLELEDLSLLFGEGEQAPMSYCYASATCEEGPPYTISCTGTSVCMAQDQNCDASPSGGWVDCDSYWEDMCDPCPIDCTGYPYMSKCIDGWSCKSGCHNCGGGSCIRGSCNCLV
jgi:hypothetical protein